MQSISKFILLYQFDTFRTLDWHYIDLEESAELFFPNLKIRQAKQLDGQPGYGPTDTQYYWFRYPHHLEYHETLKATIYCTFDFGGFPFDKQKCAFHFGSSDNADYNLNLKPSVVLHNDLTG